MRVYIDRYSNLIAKSFPRKRVLIELLTICSWQSESRVSSVPRNPVERARISRNFVSSGPLLYTRDLWFVFFSPDISR